MKYLQRLGKSLMLPVSIMPIAALLKGIGYWIDPTGWGIHNPIAALLIAAGGAIIDNLPILFAIASRPASEVTHQFRKSSVA